MSSDSLGDRMKRYEISSSTYLSRRIPVIMRLDGKAFHTYVKHFKDKDFFLPETPFNLVIQGAMSQTAKDLMKNVQGAKLAYVQSDEITILITDFDRLNTDAWFDYSVQKMCSIGASLCTAFFNKSIQRDNVPFASFDCRVFNIPKEDVVNNFLWRQQDCIRNSISMYTRHFYSHKECHRKNSKDMHEMLHAKGKNWATLPAYCKEGIFFFADGTIETFTVHTNRSKINNLLIPAEE